MKVFLVVFYFKKRSQSDGKFALFYTHSSYKLYLSIAPIDGSSKNLVEV